MRAVGLPAWVMHLGEVSAESISQMTVTRQDSDPPMEWRPFKLGSGKEGNKPSLADLVQGFALLPDSSVMLPANLIPTGKAPATAGSEQAKSDELASHSGTAQVRERMGPCIDSRLFPGCQLQFILHSAWQ